MAVDLRLYTTPPLMANGVFRSVRLRDANLPREIIATSPRALPWRRACRHRGSPQGSGIPTLRIDG